MVAIPVCNDFKLVYQSGSKEEAANQISFMIDKWKKQYPRVAKLLMDPTIFSFYNFPPSIRRTIYSTNLIEGFNKQLKKYTKKNNSLMKNLWRDSWFLNSTTTIRKIHKGFKEIQDTLELMF